MLQGERTPLRLPPLSSTSHASKHPAAGRSRPHGGRGLRRRRGDGKSDADLCSTGTQWPARWVMMRRDRCRPRVGARSCHRPRDRDADHQHLDVMEDATRAYLRPHAALVAAGINPEGLRKGLGSGKMAPVIEDLLALADLYYASGDQGMPAIPPVHAWPSVPPHASTGRSAPVSEARPRRDTSEPSSPRGVNSSASRAHRVRHALRGLPPRPHDARLHAALQGRPGASKAEPHLRLLKTGK